MDIALILQKRFYDKKWSISGNEYSGLEWFDETEKPTEDLLISMWDSVVYEYEYEQVETKRQEQYKKESDPLFFKWQLGEIDKQIWIDKRELIKKENPYPIAN